MIFLTMCLWGIYITEHLNLLGIQVEPVLHDYPVDNLITGRRCERA